MNVSAGENASLKFPIPPWRSCIIHAAISFMQSWLHLIFTFQLASSRNRLARAPSCCWVLIFPDALLFYEQQKLRNGETGVECVFLIDFRLMPEEVRRLSGFEERGTNANFRSLHSPMFGRLFYFKYIIKNESHYENWIEVGGTLTKMHYVGCKWEKEDTGLTLRTLLKKPPVARNKDKRIKRYV